ncbi:L,D-transpeptidase [Legionella sp. D16C41]|uniref:L,D-transpeptidase n=1 Tax=Legionella sp. D16C41 TaxID=3402688 RepID=UPI003AF6150D
MRKSALLLGVFFYCLNGYAQAFEHTKDKLIQQQIFLDEKNFSPGKIDGKNGKFFQQALQYYKLSNPLEEVISPTPYTFLRLNPLFFSNESNFSLKDDNQNKFSQKSSYCCTSKLLQAIVPSSPYTFYTIKIGDKNYIGSVPEKISMQAKQKKLLYANFAEFIAERFHTDRNFLKKLNPNTNLNTLKVNDKLRVPNVTPFLIENLTQKVLYKSNQSLKNRVIKINTQAKILLVLDNNKIIAFFPITPGSKELPAPKGTWKIKSIIYLPWFRYDKEMLLKGKRSANYYNLPPGANNPVGVVWMSLNKKGIGIHGTNESETIGRSTSHGCIRLTNWDIVKLSQLIAPGVNVEIN